jgi:hypothetical protein
MRLPHSIATTLSECTKSPFHGLNKSVSWRTFPCLDVFEEMAVVASRNPSTQRRIHINFVPRLVACSKSTKQIPRFSFKEWLPCSYSTMWLKWLHGGSENLLRRSKIRKRGVTDPITPWGNGTKPARAMQRREAIPSRPTVPPLIVPVSHGNRHLSCTLAPTFLGINGFALKRRGSHAPADGGVC